MLPIYNYDFAACNCIVSIFYIRQF